MVKQFKTLFSLLIKSPSWKFSEVLGVTGESFHVFMTMILIGLSYSEKQILFAFACFYLLSYLCLVFGKKLFIHYQKPTLTISFLLIIGSLVVFLLTPKEGGYIALVVSGALIYVLKDWFRVELFNDIASIAANHSIYSSKLISFSLIVTMIMPVIFMPVFGIVLDISHVAFGVFVLGVSSILLLVYWIENIQIQVEPDENDRAVIKTPWSVYIQCLLSSFMNATSFISKRFILPLIILKVSELYGISDDVFKILGLFFGIFALIALINKLSRTQTDINAFRLMMINYGLCLLAWVGVVFVYYQLQNASNTDNALMLLAVAVLMILVQEISSRFWTAGFLEYLKSQSNHYAQTSGVDSGDLNKQFLSTFMIFKSIGGACGFALAFAVYDLWNVAFPVSVMITLALLYGGAAIWYFTRARPIPV